MTFEESQRPSMRSLRQDLLKLSTQFTILPQKDRSTKVNDFNIKRRNFLTSILLPGKDFFSQFRDTSVLCKRLPPTLNGNFSSLGDVYDLVSQVVSRNGTTTSRHQNPVTGRIVPRGEESPNNRTETKLSS